MVGAAGRGVVAWWVWPDRPGRGHGSPGGCHGALVLFWGLVMGMVVIGWLVVALDGPGRRHGGHVAHHGALVLVWYLGMVAVWCVGGWWVDVVLVGLLVGVWLAPPDGPGRGHGGHMGHHGALVLVWHLEMVAV